MSVNYESETDKKLDFEWEKVGSDVISTALRYVNCPFDAEVNLLLTDDESIREINREYRNIDKSTDVLSFPMIDFETAGDFSFIDISAESDYCDYFNPETDELVLGDIIISVEHVFAQAQEYGHSTTREFAFLVAHSMFHLFGYDHVDDDERMIMENKQEDVLKILNINR